jgi:hypothetical protein
MGGEITVDSIFGKGTKFTMFLNVQINENPIIEEEDNTSLLMEKIKPGMLALGNSLLSGGFLGNGSAYFDQSEGRKKEYWDEDETNLEKKLNKILKKKKKLSQSTLCQDKYLLFSSN